MPLNLPDKLPAIELLKEENIFVIDNSRATQQDIRPLRIVILNLMPLKITTETDLVRLLSNTPLQVEICWAAQAGLYHHYGVPKYALDKKMFGIFEHRPLDPLHAIFRGFDDMFYVPHSRHTEVRKEDILKVPELTLLSESEDAGVHLVVARGGREFFVTGHSEYSPLTLDTEYRRDVDKGLPIEVPRNYYVDNDPDKGVMVRWRAHANLLFSNWLNYFVYQETPYNINDIK